jgi:N-acyl amino acid synthase of PEP-CTERM/exosortase system
MSFLSVEQKDFAAHFHGSEVKPGRNEALMRRAFELRYDVYCRECHFLNPEDYPDHRESDEYDVQSVHFAAFDRSEGLAGYVRLVCPDAIETFPFQNHCVELLEGVQLPPALKSAEISRLMVREDFRRRRGDLVAGASAEESGAPPANELRDGSPQILLTLYREMYAHSVRNGIRYWYAAMERSLARTLTRMNFGFRQIGPATNYYGPVAPYVADLRELEMGLSQCNPALFAWMQQAPGNHSSDEPAFSSSQVC